MNKIPWLEEVIEGKLDDGTAYKAICRYWAKDVNVRMISPFEGKCAGRHMMYLDPRSYTQDGFWKVRAVSLIRSLIERERWLKENAVLVKARKLARQHKIREAKNEIFRLTVRKAKLRGKLMLGGIADDEWRKRINALNQQIWSIKASIAQEELNDVDGVI